MFHCYGCEATGETFAGYGAGYRPWDVEEIWEPCEVCNGKGKTWRFWRFPLWVLKDKFRNMLYKQVVYEEEDIPF